jgi:hypothetical protein
MNFSHNNQKTAETDSQTLPFTGLGFETDTVQTMAQTMTPCFCPHSSTVPCLSDLDSVPQPSGYKLLVTLGREIRGR